MPLETSPGAMSR